MSSLFRIRRPDGDVQIDDNYRLFTLKEIYDAHISVSPPANQGLYQMASFALAGPEQDVFVACRSTILFATVWQSRRSSSGWSISYMFSTGSSSPAEETVRFYIFTPKVGGASPGVRFRTYDATGALCADLIGTKPVRVKGVQTGTGTWSGTPGRIYAPVSLRSGRAVVAAPPNSIVCQLSCFRCDGHSVAVSNQNLLTRTSYARRSVTSQALIVDVTDY